MLITVVFVTFTVLSENWVKFIVVVKFSVISNALYMQTTQTVFNFTDILVLHFFYTKCGNFWNITRLLTRKVTVTNSQKQSGLFWPTLYM